MKLLHQLAPTLPWLVGIDCFEEGCAPRNRRGLRRRRRLRRHEHAVINQSSAMLTRTTLLLLASVTQQDEKITFLPARRLA